MRTENQIRMAIMIAEKARDKSNKEWEDFLDNNTEKRPPFTVKVCGVTINVVSQDFDPFITGLRYALGEGGDDID